MESHPEPVMTEPTAVDALPDTGDNSSFESALNNAFASLDNATEPKQEPAPEPVSNEAVEETPVTADDEPLESLTEDIGDEWTPKAANRFKQIKTELKNSTAELETLRQAKVEYEGRIKELSALAENKDVEVLQARVEEFERQQMFSNLESTSAYKQAITQPLVTIMDQADQIASKYDVAAEALIDVLAIQDAQEQEERIAEILPNASDRDKAKVYRLIEEINPILARRDYLKQSAAEAYQEAQMLEERQQMAELAERAKTRLNVTRNVVERVEQKLPFLKSISGLDMSAIRDKAAAADPASVHPVDFAYNAVSAQLLPTVVREYAALRKEVESLTDRLAEYESAEPTMSGNTPSSRRAAQFGNVDASFEDRVNAAFSAIG